MAARARTTAQKAAAESAINSIGLGYDLTVDLRLKYCKTSSSSSAGDPRLIAIDDDVVREIAIPGGVCIPSVPKSIKCDKGERLRFGSDVLSFQQMSEQFNQELSLSGKIPTGHFNTAFEFTGGWQKDAANTRALAFDGISITLYTIALDKSQVLLRDHVKQAVPSSWDSAALARFIEKYGTHVIVGVKMGGKDTIYVKQQHSSPLQPADVQKKLKDMADKLFVEGSGYNRSSNKSHMRDTFTKEHGLANIIMDTIPSSSYSWIEMQDTKFTCKRKGGSLYKNLSHDEWCQTVYSEPDVISMSLVPITSLLSGINGSGFLSHAINLYLRYKPPIEELHQFLDFQLPRQWAPVFGELALGPQKKPQGGASLQFSFMGPKLYVNTTPVMLLVPFSFVYAYCVLEYDVVSDFPTVDVVKKPVTGIRLYLEGKRSNCLAIHLQHLSSLPKTFQLKDEVSGDISDRSSDRRYYEKVQWKSFSHVCTAPVEANDDHSVVTGAHFEVGDSNLKKVLFLRLHFSKVVGATTVRQPEWDGSPGLVQKSGIISTLISTHFSAAAQKPPPKPSDVNINSAVYPGGPPVPTQTPKLLRFVDTTEMTRGPQDSPGYWAVSGARLVVDKGKISLRVKYSLLTVILPDEEVSEEF
ncbi:Membrane attack complex component/perforin (MACPF) domain containing protein [Parasponia andersonii]|uniref:Membrane attack complex component/perforin (MACPF) domain containing protein n=1 Tax=Parasponia andersonii TaxID=3476 RepID=A0A2P5BIY6_PARAD|nr:Membrane attack complex component/perforin (MACPF) domain containing protein [Parasponia andersonii]